ncbi:MAG: glycosyltransferase, partial [Nanoarchaeota archaeon]|nr:glycosyltransferase [Nanoarchaeota archaeon]
EDELQAFDVFVFPSTWSLEGFGLVLAEAMNAGVPIVATDFGPIPEVVGDAACLVKPTPKDLACGIEKVLSDEKYAENLRQEGFSQVKRFDINKIADKYYELLADCS